MTYEQWFTIIGLGMDIIGVGLLTWPWISRFGRYAEAKARVKVRKIDGTASGGFAHEELGLLASAMEIKRDIELAWGGFVLIALGFIFQMVGVFVRPLQNPAMELTSCLTRYASY